MSKRSVDVIEVRAWGRTVGATAFDEGRDAYAFEYDPGWIRDGADLSPLHVPRRPGVFVFPELDRTTFHGLVPFLADALPDRFGNALIDAWMAAQGVRRADVSALDRLAYTADRAMGALEFHPPAAVATADLHAIALADLVTAARGALRGELVDGPEAEHALRQLIQVGTSAGGARPKAVIAYHPATSQIRSGQLDAPEGFEHWLIKLDGIDVDPTRESPVFGQGGGYGIIEYAYHRMAVAAGIEMEACRLLPEGPRVHFLTRRFDRTADGGRRHLLSLCGLDHLDFNQAGAHGYDQYLAAVEALGIGPAGREQAFRRMVFNVAAVNHDDHTKNLAFVLPEGGDWELAPAYDVTYAHNPDGVWTRSHQMTVDGKRDGITRHDLETVGDRWSVPRYRQAVDEVLAAVDDWPVHADEAGLDEPRTAAIAADHAAHRPR